MSWIQERRNTGGSHTTTRANGPRRGRRMVNGLLLSLGIPKRCAKAKQPTWQLADIYIIDAEGNGPGKPIVESVGQDLSPAWVPEGFLSVSPGAEKQMTLWGRLKQLGK